MVVCVLGGGGGVVGVCLCVCVGVGGKGVRVGGIATHSAPVNAQSQGVNRHAPHNTIKFMDRVAGPVAFLTLSFPSWY